MNSRKMITNDSKGDILVSIHQNSYTSESIKGAQVFYHKNSEKSKALALSVQAQLVEFADKTNKRAAKGNDDYYVLRTTEMPSIIVECGFISNPTEESKLLNQQYQEEIAWSIYKGIINYFTNE